jgi:hypothetical protein
MSASANGGPRSRVCARETLRSPAPPIDTSGNFLAHMSVECKNLKPYENPFWDLTTLGPTRKEYREMRNSSLPKFAPLVARTSLGPTNIRLINYSERSACAVIGWGRQNKVVWILFSEKRLKKPYEKIRSNLGHCPK